MLTKLWLKPAWRHTKLIHILFALGNIKGASQVAKEAINWQVVSRPEAANDIIESGSEDFLPAQVVSDSIYLATPI